MEISIAGQAAAFSGGVMLGFAAGILYDSMRLIRRHLRIPLLGAILDLFFWVAVTVALFCFVTVAEAGKVRIYVLLAVFGGAVLYFLALSAWVRSLGELLAEGIAAMFRCILFPVRITGELTKKIQKKLKNIFLYRRKWYKIRAVFERMEEVEPLKTTQKEEGGCHENRKSRTADQSLDSRTSDRCGDLSVGTQQPIGSGTGTER